MGEQPKLKGKKKTGPTTNTAWLVKNVGAKSACGHIRRLAEISPRHPDGHMWP